MFHFFDQMLSCLVRSSRKNIAFFRLPKYMPTQYQNFITDIEYDISQISWIKFWKSDKMVQIHLVEYYFSSENSIAISEKNFIGIPVKIPFKYQWELHWDTSKNSIWGTNEKIIGIPVKIALGKQWKFHWDTSEYCLGIPVKTSLGYQWKFHLYSSENLFGIPVEIPLEYQ